jgi:hypothetical protein
MIKLTDALIRERTARPNNRREWKEYNARPRVYVRLTFEGSSILDDLYLRKMHSPRKLRPIVMDTLKEMGVSVDEMSWSRYAGCSCPCSPGFIIKDYTLKEGMHHRFDAWLEYTYTD